MHRMCSLLLVLLLSLLMLSPSDALEEIPQLPQLPRGWQGSCEAHGVASECSVWRDGPAYRLVFLDFVHGGVGIALGLPPWDADRRPCDSGHALGPAQHPYHPHRDAGARGLLF